MPLKTPVHRVVSLWKIQDMLDHNMIQLDAPYQRGIVWPTSKMSMLIDSIMKRYYIPPLLFAVRTESNGRKTRVCIDGKQRLTSILRFVKNQIPYLDESTGITEEIYFDPNNNPKKDHHHQYLNEDERDNFYDTEIVMMEFSDLDEDQELEIFARVQMGVSITAADKLLATSSQVSTFCRELVQEHEHLATSIDKHLLGAAFKWIAQLVFILHVNDDKFVATQPKLMEFLKDRTITLDDSFKRKTKRTIRWLDSLFKSEAGKMAITYKNGNEGRKRRYTLRNIEFLVFGTYINDLNHNFKLPQLTSDLTSMRQYFVEEYKRQLYTGNPCWTAGMQWKGGMLENRRRTTPAITQVSSSTGRQHGVVAESDSSSSDENDMDSDETGRSDGRQLTKQRRQDHAPPSKRRRGGRKEPIEIKHEGYQAMTSSTTRGHVNEHGRPLARRGGKKSFGVGRNT